MRTTVSYFKTDSGSWVLAWGFSGNNFGQVQGQIQDSVANGDNPPELLIPVRLPRRLRLGYRGFRKVLLGRQEVDSPVIETGRISINHDHSLDS